MLTGRTYSPGSADAARWSGWVLSERSPVARYALAMVLALAAALITIEFAWALDRNIFMLFLIATTLTSLLAGWAPGLLSMVMGALAFGVMLSPPIGRLRIASPIDQARVASFVIITSLVIALCERLRRTSRRVDQRQVELREGLEMLETLLEATPLAVVTLDNDSRVQLWNPAAERLFGWRAAEVIGQPYPLVPAALEPERRERLARMQRDGRGFSGLESRRLRKDGTEVDVTLWMAPLRDGAGRVVGTLGLAADAREQRAMQARLREAQKLEALGGLAGGVAHDFNNMLTAILSSAELAMMEVPDEHPVHGDLTEIRKAALRAAGLTRQLLAFGRRQVLQPRALHLATLVAELTPSLQRMIGPAVTMVTEVEKGLRPIHADRTQVEQVIESLVENAREAMPAGGELRITARQWTPSAPAASGCPASVGADYVLISVADTGSGMDDQTLARVFEPFFTTKPFGTSAGLGLATSYGIVRQSGGHIWATSTPQLGSTFHVLLPASEETSELPSVPAGYDRPTVLLVDDEDAVRALAARLLERAGYDVVACSDGEHALRRADELERPADLLVTDLVMPRVSGSRLAKQLHERWSSLEVIYMSGFTEAEAVSYGLQQGAHFLSKPFDMTALLSLIANVLEESRAAA